MTDVALPPDDEAVTPIDRWLREGWRAARFRPVRTDGLRAAPSTVLTLLALLVLSGIALQRWAITGPAQFDPMAIAGGWLATLLTLGICWTVARSRGALPPVDTAPTAPTTPTLFALLLALELVLTVPLGLVYLATAQWGPLLLAPEDADALRDSVWMLSVVWIAYAAALLLWRQAAPRRQVRAAIVGVAVLGVAVQFAMPGAYFWVTDAEADADGLVVAEAEAPPWVITQTLIESQSHALPVALDALAAERPGVVDLYAITFAPYADEDVFTREATLVSEVMRSRFDAQQRVVQLQNHPGTAATVPWATPQNLQRAIERVARVMNRDEDVLFIHLTSHGARDGQLAATFEPLAVDAVTPQLLGAWLDRSGVRYRVISISACYSGSWIAPLSGPGTLVMTAADADNTSYGCGSKSELTFFGRAMYDEQLRTTRSFEAAHAAVRPVIAQREKEAGKTDGYSNPQIAVGEAVRAPLLSLQQRLDAASPPTR